MRGLLLVSLMLAAAPAAVGQALVFPRTADGRPDFQGEWSTKWRTPLERQKEAEGPVVSADKVSALVAALDAGLKAMGNLSPDVDFDWGPFMPAAGGGFRTSLIVEPADGKRPLTQAAKDMAKSAKDDSDRAEGPEVRGPSERCVHGPGTTPLSISPGNQNHQIVQTPGYLVLTTEDISDLRLIRMGGAPLPEAMVSWNGDSVAHWDGDTLVIETRLLRPERNAPAPAPSSPPRQVTERLRFNTPDELNYRYEIDDPSMFATAVAVEMILRRTDERMFEVACHEANYSLAGILSGARMDERKAAGKSKP